MKPRDGGDAFPSPGVVLTNQSGLPQQQGAYSGMTLRMYLAAKAMQGRLADPTMDLSTNELAANAFLIADAMLREAAK